MLHITQRQSEGLKSREPEQNSREKGRVRAKDLESQGEAAKIKLESRENQLGSQSGKIQ